jgi:nitrite reductase (NADH) large subunit
MRVVIVGNGLAGTIAAKTLRELDAGVEIEVFAEEKYHYYPRPNLIEFLAGRLARERLFAFSQEWYKEQKIALHLNKPVRKILPDSKQVEVDGAKQRYDFLLLANGSLASVPPFKGAEKKGVFTLRTLDDALRILDQLKTRRRVVIIGGGLLGLEIARALRSIGAEVEVVEFFERLLPRQLDLQGAGLLKSQIEKTGIKVHLGLTTEDILGRDEVKGLRFKGGKEMEADLAIIAAGIMPNIQIAKQAGLETRRGLVVNEYLQSSRPEIFAAGDVIEHGGKVYGIIPASFNQARIAARNILGKAEKYEGTVLSNTLKVVGIDLTSIGLVNPEQGSAEEYRKEKKEEGLYKKVAIQNGIVVGAVWMGTKKGVHEVSRIITERINVERWKDSLLEDDFDFHLL